MRSVSVSKIKNELSAHLREVTAGGSFLITEHSRPVAVLGPVPTMEGSQAGLSALVADGVALPPVGKLDFKKLGKLRLPTVRGGLSQALAEDREGR